MKPKPRPRYSVLSIIVRLWFTCVVISAAAGVATEIWRFYQKYPLPTPTTWEVIIYGPGAVTIVLLLAAPFGLMLGVAWMVPDPDPDRSRMWR